MTLSKFNVSLTAAPISAGDTKRNMLLCINLELKSNATTHERDYVRKTVSNGLLDFLNALHDRTSNKTK